MTFFQRILKYPWSIVLGCTLICGLFAYFALGLTFSDDTRQFFSADYPPLQALEALEETYDRLDAVSFTLAPHDGNVFTSQVLIAVQALTHEAWKIPHSSRVESLTNFQYTRAVEDELIVADLVADPQHLSNEQLAEIRAVALAEPYLVNHLVSQQGHVVAVNVTILKADDREAQNQETMVYVHRLKKDFEKQFPDLAVYLTGGVISDVAFAEASQQDTEALIPLMFLVMTLFMIFLLRSLTACVATFLVILFSCITAMGMAAFLRITLLVSKVHLSLSGRA